jgi:rhodanese-related sulfurtransferase
MVEHVSVRHLAEAMSRGDAHVVDVREGYEYAAGHVPGAVHVPMHLVPLRVGELPRDKDLYLICETGNRSFQVGLYLARQGISSHNVEGGTSAWRWAGGPLSTGSAA